MKTTQHFFYLISFLCCLLFSKKSVGQACSSTFSYGVGPNGTVTFSATSASTLANANYSWTFGGGNSASAINLSVTANTYSYSGMYFVTLSIAGCSATTQTVIVNNASLPTCSLQINYTAPTSTSLCNGSATVTNVTGLCGSPNYAWVPAGPSNSVITGLCVNTLYNVNVFSAPGFSCCSLITGTLSIPGPTCAIPNASFTTVQGGNGSVTFNSTSTGTTAGSTYVWQFGDATPNGSGSSTTHTYTGNGTYNVMLFVTNPGGCIDSSVVTPLPINSVTCALNPTIVAIYTSSTSLTFSTNSTGTNSTTAYNWNFGDGSTATSSVGFGTVHTYTANGLYTVTLTVSNLNTPGCVVTVTAPVNINGAPGPCNLAANFAYTVSPGGLCVFTNLTSGTTGNTTYTWNFSGSSSLVSVANPVSHQYTFTGTFVVQLIASNNSAPTCTAITTKTVYVPCTINAAYTHTVGALGQVSFESTSTGTNPGTTYFWDFGDGVYNGGSSPIHTYMNAGAYLVKLKTTNGDSTCTDTVPQYINVTGVPCTANSNFTLTPTGIPQYWNATPFYPWNVSSASWSWGDGSSSNTLYTSHTYSVAGSYNICLSVTLSCGSTASTCTSYSVYRSQSAGQSMSMAYVNVTKPGLSTSIQNASEQEIRYTIYPNPNNGRFQLDLPDGLAPGTLQVRVYAITGETVYKTSLEHTDGRDIQEIDLGDAASGLYFIKVSSGNLGFTKKITLQK